MQVTRGQRLVIAGPNGAGKSTLLRVLDGKLRPQTGICLLYTSYYCLLFDVDGTRLDFGAAENGALRETLAHFALPESEEAVQAYHTINNGLWAALERGEVRQEKLVVQRFARLLEHLGAQGDPAAINDYYLSQLAQRSDT